jgi:hypothetical protein
VRSTIIKLAMASNDKKFDGVYIDILGFMPTLTHLFYHGRLNRRFSFLQSPDVFCKKYREDFDASRSTVKQKEPFIHNFGSIRTLSLFETKTHYWRNIFANDLPAYLSCKAIEGLFPYAPYWIKPNMKIGVACQDPQKAAYANRMRLSVDIALYPQGFAVAHLKVYVKGPLSVAELQTLQKMLTDENVFCMNPVSAKKLNMKTKTTCGQDEVFKAIRDRFFETMYLGGFDMIDQYPMRFHRVVFPICHGTATIDDDEVARIILLSENPHQGEVKRIKNQRSEGLDPGDILAFGQGATLLWTPKSDPRKYWYFRYNYTRAVEFSLAQNFWLYLIRNRVNSAITGSNIAQPPDVGELDISELGAIYGSLLKAESELKGGHQNLYEVIARTTNCERKREDYKMSTVDILPLIEILKQIDPIEKTLIAAKKESAKTWFSDDTYGLAVNSFNQLQLIKAQVNAAMSMLNNAIAAAPYNDALLDNARVNISQRIQQYADFLDTYQTLVEKIIQESAAATSQTTSIPSEATPTPQGQPNKDAEAKKTADSQLQAAKDTLDKAKDSIKTPSGPSLWDKIKKYAPLIIQAANFALKATGLI